MQRPIRRPRPARWVLASALLAVWLGGGGIGLAFSARLAQQPGSPERRPRRLGPHIETPAPPAPMFGRRRRGDADVPTATERFCLRPQAGPEERAHWSLLGVEARLSPLEKRLFADAADGRLDQFSLLEAALVAGGAQDAETLRRYHRRLVGLVKQLRESGRLGGPSRRQARVVFEFMHRRVLTAGYRTDCTDLRGALDHGRFNCLSASVLFNCLAGELGLAVCGLEIPGHAMSRVVLADGRIDVETTCAHWFRLADDPRERAELVEKTTGQCPRSVRSRAREVGAIQMAAMIYYNRGVDLLADRRFAQAATANAKALWLDPQSATARGNLLATINNWAIALGNSGRYAEAVDLLREGLKLEPAYQTFALNYVHVHQRWVEDLCQAGRFEEALEVLARAAAELPERVYFRRAGSEICGRWG